MNILFVSEGNIYKGSAHFSRVFDQLYSLVSIKHHNIFFLSFISVKAILTERKSLKIRYEEIINSGIKKAIFIPLPFITKPIFFGIIARMLAGVIIRVFSQQFSANVVHCSPGGAGFMACFAKKLGLTRPLFIDIHGAEPEEFIDKSKHSSIYSKTYRFIAKTEKAIVSEANVTLLVSHEMKKHLRRKYYPLPKRTLIVPCVCEFEKNNFAIYVRDQMRDYLSLNDKFVILYTGALKKGYQKADRILTFFSAVKTILPQSFLCLLSPDMEKGNELCEQAGLSKKNYMIKYVPHQEIGRYMQVGDIGLLPRENKVLNHVSSPTKFGEYLASGVPVVLSPNVMDAAQIVHKKGVGCVNNTWSDVSTNMQNFLLSVLNEREMWYKRCRQFVQNYYTWRLMANRIESEWKNSI